MNISHRSRRISLVLSALLLSRAAVADDVLRCSTPRGAGQWGYSVTGTNTVGAPDSIVGSGVADASGKVVLTQTEATNGQAREEVLQGNVTINPDCTAKFTANVFVSGNLILIATWSLVYVDNQREIRGTLSSLTLPNGAVLPLPSQTLDAKRLFMIE
jgi:hypothetical protein